jgi:hypothetical protein
MSMKRVQFLATALMHKTASDSGMRFSLRALLISRIRSSVSSGRLQVAEITQVGQHFNQLFQLTKQIKYLSSSSGAGAISCSAG